MSRRRTLVAIGTQAVLLVAALALAPAVAAGDPCYHGYTIPPATTEATSAVRMDPCAFRPTNAEVAPGTTVTFTNSSGEAHLLMGANGTFGDRDVEVAPGASVTHAFSEPGVYAFSCAFHRGMTGAIIVRDPAADAAAASTTGSTGSTGGGLSTGMTMAILALGAMAVAGWAAALAAVAQRRRMAA